MANKRVPSEPSYFVSSILRPVKAFFGVGTGEGVGISLKDDFLVKYLEVIFDTITQKYESTFHSKRRQVNVLHQVHSSPNHDEEDGRVFETAQEREEVDVLHVWKCNRQ